MPEKVENNNNKESIEGGKNFQDISESITNTLQDIDNRKISSSLEPSEPSEPSDIIRQERTLHRIGQTDNWECQSCILTGDKHFMIEHICSKRRR